VRETIGTPGQAFRTQLHTKRTRKTKGRRKTRPAERAWVWYYVVVVLFAVAIAWAIAATYQAQP
jgi:hypothetical protein